MKNKNLVCFNATQQQIDRLNNKKPFLICQQKLYQIINDRLNFSTGASNFLSIMYLKFSQILFAEFIATADELAALTKVSRRTIHRYLDELESKKWISRINRHDHLGKTIPNAYILNIPDYALDLCNKQKDRKKTYTKNDLTNSAYSEAQMNNMLENETKTDVNPQFMSCDKNVIPNINNINIYNNKQPKLDKSVDKSTTGYLFNDIDKKLNDLKNEELRLLSKATVLDNWHKIQELRANIVGIEKLLSRKEEAAKIKDSVDFESRLPESIPKSSRGYLYGRLKNLGYKGRDIKRIADEIIFSWQFGSLKYYKSGGNAIPLTTAINIAIKIIKDNKWTTPSGYLNWRQM